MWNKDSPLLLYILSLTISNICIGFWDDPELMFSMKLMFSLVTPQGVLPYVKDQGQLRAHYLVHEVRTVIHCINLCITLYLYTGKFFCYFIAQAVKLLRSLCSSSVSALMFTVPHNTITDKLFHLKNYLFTILSSSLYEYIE